MSDELRAIGERLMQAAKDERAYGLAAAHIGEVAPVVVVSADAKQHRLLFNPRIVAVADQTTAAEEGSVSLPGVRVEIRRPVWCEVTFHDAEGASERERFDGFAATVVQHEIDQMLGVFFLERLSRLKRDMILRKLRKAPG